MSVCWESTKPSWWMRQHTFSSFFIAFPLCTCARTGRNFATPPMPQIIYPLAKHKHFLGCTPFVSKRWLSVANDLASSKVNVIVRRLHLVNWWLWLAFMALHLLQHLLIPGNIYINLRLSSIQRSAGKFQSSPGTPLALALSIHQANRV